MKIYGMRFCIWDKVIFSFSLAYYAYYYIETSTKKGVWNLYIVFVLGYVVFA